MALFVLTVFSAIIWFQFQAVFRRRRRAAIVVAVVFFVLAGLSSISHIYMNVYEREMGKARLRIEELFLIAYFVLCGVLNGWWYRHLKVQQIQSTSCAGTFASRATIVEHERGIK